MAPAEFRRDAGGAGSRGRVATASTSELWMFLRAPPLAFRLTEKSALLSNAMLLRLSLLLALPCGVLGESNAAAGIGAPGWLRPSYHFTRAKFHMNGAYTMHDVRCQARGPYQYFRPACLATVGA